jgi:Spy/CpxP family protein refolding chaperone
MKTKQVWIIAMLAALLLTPMALAADGQQGRRGREGDGGPGRGGPGPAAQHGPQGTEFGQQRPGMGMMGRSPQGGPGQGQMQRWPQDGPAGGMDIGQHIWMLARAAELTPEQQEAVKAIVEESRPAAQENQKALQEATKALREAVMEGDTKAVKACAKEFSRAMTDQAVASAEVIKAVKAELTPEQLEKLKALRTEMQQRRGWGQAPDDQMDNDDRPAPGAPPADAQQPARQRQDRPRLRKNAQ